ncbi:MAG TPA: YbfB/YjiJ family MFS transporter, partial [Kribbella sp.]
MAAVSGSGRATAGAGSPVRPWRIVGQGGAALTAGMGIGRFAYTPILPLMHAQAGLSPKLGAELATANYLGYLVGSLAAIAAPALVRSRSTLRVALLVLIGTLVLMPSTHVG